MSTAVLVGGRKVKRQVSRPLPEIFVENEDNVRFRKDIPHSTPYYNQSPDMKLKGETTNNQHEDSGFSDWNTSSSRFDRSTQSSYSARSRSSPEDNGSSVWESLASPIIDIKDKLRGNFRQSFVEARPKLRVKDLFSLEKLLTGCMTTIMLSSILYSLFIGSAVIPSQQLNGKLRSVKYGSEQRILTLKKEGRIIDYDIKDAEGNILGGKRAAMQFAFQLRQEKEAEEFLLKVAPDLMEAPSEVPVHRDKDSDQEIGDKHARNQERKNHQLSIFEISQKIEDLNKILQSGLSELSAEDVDLLQSEIQLLRLNKKNLVKKLQQTNKGGSVKPRVTTMAPIAYEDLEVDEDGAGDGMENDGEPRGQADQQTEEQASDKKTTRPKKRNPKQPKTKAANPLTKSLPENNQSVPKTNEAAAAAAGRKTPTSSDFPDYPDDPQFRSSGGVPDDPNFRKNPSDIK